jgi:hypothetical protein
MAPLEAISLLLLATGYTCLAIGTIVKILS